MEQAPRRRTASARAVYLEALFRGAGVPADRMAEVRGLPRRDCMSETASLVLASPPGTHEALDRLRAAGLRLGVVSNSDGRVEEALTAAGSARLLRRGPRLGAW